MALGVERFTGPTTSSASSKGSQVISKRRRADVISKQLKQEWKYHESHARDLAEFIKPRRPRFITSDRNKGDRRNLKIIDSTGTFAARTLQAGMHAGMTSPARPWMKLTTPDPDLAEFPAVKEYLHNVTQRMLAVFASTNLYNSLPVHYGDMGVFATAATGMLGDNRDVFRTYSYPIGSYGIATDKRGNVNIWSYETEKSVLEVVEEYVWDETTSTFDWSKATPTLKTQYDAGNFTAMVPIGWVVMPNVVYNPKRLRAAEALPFYSCHFELGQDRDDTFLRDGGYEEFPILVSRWDVTGDDWWGTDCPGMVALGDIKQLQTGEKRGLQAIEKMVNPPLKAPTSMRTQKTSLLPADITYYDVISGNEGPTALHEVSLRLDHLEAKQQGVRDRIRRAFYEDLFMMLAFSDGQRGIQPVSAAEIAERHEEKLIVLGPVVERTNDELLDRLVDRAYSMMGRNGMLPEPPSEVEGVDLRTEYTSIMAQAQKLVNVVTQERFLTSVMSVSQVFPQARHKVDVFEAIDDLGDLLGVNPEIIVPNDEARAAAEAEAKQAAEAAQAEQMKTGAAAAQSLAKADMEPDSALRRIVEGAI